MGYTYTPTYYTSLQDSITSICKNILPFSFKKKRLPAIAAAEQRLSKQQSDNLKWQQESFHQILNLMGLCKEGILAETEVSAFRTHLLETLIAAPLDYEQSIILRDKLIFLQELLYANCISDDEYHASKRPLLQRLAVQGAEIEASDVIVGVKKDPLNEEWSVIDLKEDKFFVNPKMITLKNKTKENSAKKKIKGSSSVFDLVSPNKYGKLKEKDVMSGADLNVSTNGIRGNALERSVENPFWNSDLNESESELRSILMMESSPVCSIAEKQICSKKKENAKSAKKIWGFDGFKKWKKNESEDERAPLSLMEKSYGGDYGGTLVANPIVEGPDTKQIKRKLHPTGAPSDFFVDKMLGDNIKKELSRIQTELGARNPHIQLSDVQIDTISTRLPADKADLNKFFPKSWCDRHGEVVLDVVKKEFKDHVGEMGNSRAIARENNKNNSKRWTTFDDHDQENSHPNLFAPQQDNSYSMKQTSFSASKNVRTSFNSSIDKGFKYNPFFDM